MFESVDTSVPSGDADAANVVSDWFDRHVDTIYAYVSRRAGDDVARDVTSETFRVALEQFDRFDSTVGAERAWLYGIASNLLRRHWRAEQRRLRAHLRHASRAQVPGDPLVAVDARVDAGRRVERVIAAVERLDPDDRDLLLLIVWEHCTSAEAARALGIPAGTVRSRLKRIRALLKNDEGVDSDG